VSDPTAGSDAAPAGDDLTAWARSTQVWEVRISDERGRLVCVSRCTLAVVPLAPG
jgi:acyl-coenzyme A thioesterase PaaI-like protein